MTASRSRASPKYCSRTLSIPVEGYFFSLKLSSESKRYQREREKIRAPWET